MSDTQLNTSAAVGLAQDSKSPKKKMVWLEMLRIFAVYLVIFNHTGTTASTTGPRWTAVTATGSSWAVRR